VSPSRRPAVAVMLPTAEQELVAAELREGGFESIVVSSAPELERVLAGRRDMAVAILDGEADLDRAIDAWSVLHDAGRNIPALFVVAPAALERLAASGGDADEYLTRPYTAESVRWRIEAMCIRAIAVDDGSGPVLQGTLDDHWTQRGSLVVVFNPKGGVGKTTIATNLATTLVLRQHQRVLLVDADTVTGHVTTSLGMDAAPTVADAWADELDGGPVLTLDQLATTSSAGLKVVALASNPIHTQVLEPGRVAAAIAQARREGDFVVADLHPSYSPLNRGLFERADRILVPVTPDVPAIRAAVQLRDIADELGIRDRLAMVINRANSGVSVGDMERTIGMPAFAQIRSAGLLLVQAANEGRPVVEMSPKEKVTRDFEVLADRLLGVPEEEPVKAGFRLFGRAAAPARP
jgi:MinD-like ATPase involved in chromosome partitioning or flagellar assembly